MPLTGATYSNRSERAGRDVRQPVPQSLAQLTPYLTRIRAAWRKLLLESGEACASYVAELSGLHLPQRVRDGGSVNQRIYREECEREGRDLAHQGVPAECAALAIGLYVKSALSYLKADDLKNTRCIRNLTRWAVSYQYFLLSGYRQHDCAARQALEGRVALAERRSQDFAIELGDAYEKERRRLAQDLHDEIGHDLIVLKLYTQIIVLDLNKGDFAQVRRKLKESILLIDHALKGVRHLTFDLGPAVWSEQGFLPAVRLYTRQFASRTGLSVRFSSVGLKTSLPARYETALYKALQGALSNVVAHAGARHVKISLATRQNLVVMRVEDDGKGFNVGHKLRAPVSSYGLRAMQDRIELLGGTIHFESRKVQTRGRKNGISGGTAIEFHLPLHEVDTK
jgi:signal transduction histidine kinase